MPTPVDRVQDKLGVPRSGKWDPATAGAIAVFQRSRGEYPMLPHGHPDPATLLNLGYYEVSEVFTEPWTDYLAGGDMPGSFGRDLRTSVNQVPRWAWATVAGVFGVCAVVAYRTDKKREKARR